MYDEANQLVREDNAQLGKTVTYAYDKGGNIVTKTEYPYTLSTPGTATDTVAYTYDSTWKDKLTSYDGIAISYDAIGNPIDYTHDRYFTWCGRELWSAETEDGAWLEMRYDQNGLRNYREVDYPGTANDQKCHYYWSDDSHLLGYTYYTGDQYANEYAVSVLYDTDNSPIGFALDEMTYYYVKNIQGDVLCVVSETGAPVLYYTYDAWGSFTVTPAAGASNQEVLLVATLNPATYRGYFYDHELGLYYLQSRYYDPETGRFINADLILYGRNVVGYNLYTAFYNNPIMYKDMSGGMPTKFLNMVADMYCKGVMNSKILSGNVLLLNPKNIYLAFHEMAQIFVSRKLQSEGYYNIKLEEKIRSNMEADVVAKKGLAKYLWEIKPLGGESPEAQLKKYTNGTGYSRGKKIPSFQVNVFNSTIMKINSDNSGGVYYAFYNKRNERVPNSQLYAQFRKKILAAYAIVGGLLIATIAEDIATSGAGIWNDYLVLLNTYAVMSPIVFGAA